MKTIITKYTLLILIIACGFFTSCNDWLDVNDDPNKAETVEAGYLFNYAAVCWSSNRQGGDNYIPVAMSLQSQACGGDTYGGWGESYYDISPYSIGNTWKIYYSSAGNNLQLAIQQAKNSIPENINAQAQATILLAFQLYEATMLFGDIPFSEAWNNEIKAPKFDSQKDVLNGVIDLLDKAVGMIDVNDPLKIDDQDPFYKGDLDKWIKLANSLKLKVLILMIDADPSKAEDIRRMVEGPKMISSTADNMNFNYYETAGNENPKYGILAKYTGGVNSFFFAHNNTIKPMQKYTDSRIPCYFNPGVDGEYRGLDTRQTAEINENEEMLSSSISDYLYRKDCPDLIFSYQEQLLLEAEIYARGLGVSQDISKANELYKAGVKASCDYYKADKNATETFLLKLPDLTKLTSAEAIYEIHLQQWIDLMDRPNECFVQWRRSGTKGNEVPTLTVPENAPTPDLIRRWDYSPDELSGNMNAPKETPKVWEHLWFDL